MKRPDERLLALGRAIRAAQDALPRQGPTEADGELFDVKPRRPGRLVRVLVPCVALGIAALVIGLVARRPPALTFQVGGRRGDVGAWVVPEDSNLPIYFSDGSQVVLQRSAQARVDRTDSSGARISLERGRIDANITHRNASRWSLVAGPFTVVVLGTRFSLNWDPMLRQMELALHEGEVTLSGPVVGDGRRVRQGESLTVLAREGRLEVQSLPPAGTAPRRSSGIVVPTEPPASGGPPPPARERATSSPSAPRATRAAAPIANNWRVLAQSNRSEEALLAATDAGFDDICRSGEAADVRLLGDTARLAGRPQSARRAFETMRRRFAGTDDAAIAAFLLGKLCYDNLKSFGEAADWFSVYLDERPRGPLAREAAGRLIEARLKNGDEAAARAAARSYLTAYPNGPHARLAHGVAGE